MSKVDITAKYLWEKVQEGLLIKMKQYSPIRDISVKVNVNDIIEGCYDEYYNKEFVSLEPDRYLHVNVSATFGPRITGSVLVIIAHHASGHHIGYELKLPPKNRRGFNVSQELEGSLLSELLGADYTLPKEGEDFIKVYVFRRKKKLFAAEFPIRPVTDGRRHTKEDRLRFQELMNRYRHEPDSSLSLRDKFYDKTDYTDEEIIFMWKYDNSALGNRFPGLANYYCEVLDA